MINFNLIVITLKGWENYLNSGVLVYKGYGLTL